ncbi:uncharacterized protein [Lepeophtheirus salmonis]|uniref:uncharacterized protein n=1 Tax=Lepeophtheirus salmonis TaxID=72036 RepID=UPI001AE2ABBC|nr:E3 ubiquitin-protein ligase rnf8-like [Lepeophtheirus salmonis]
MSAELRGIPPLKSAKFERLVLSKDKAFTMGRFQGASLPILDIKVSRKPAIFEFVHGSWTLVDKASMNGVFVNGSPIPSQEPYILCHGDIIKLGPIQDYRWIFFFQEEENPPPPKRVKSLEDSSLSLDSESQMLESMERIEKERLILVEEVKESEEKTLKLLSKQKEDLHKCYRTRSDELAIKQENERQDILSKLQGIGDECEREKRLSELEERLHLEKREIENKSTTALRDVEHQIETKMRLLEENKRTIDTLQKEKQEAQDVLEREKKRFEEKIGVLKEEFENKVKNEESYQLAYKHLSEEMESKLKAGSIKIESVIEKERKEKESLKIEFEKMKTQSSHAQQRLEDVMGTCEEEFKCTICEEIFIKPVTTNCGHVFCEYCITKWKHKCKENQLTCPNCRLSVTSYSKNHYIENLIESLVRKFGDDIQKEREKLSKNRVNGQVDENESKDKEKKIHPLILAATANRISNKKEEKKAIKATLL